MADPQDLTLAELLKMGDSRVPSFNERGELVPSPRTVSGDKYGQPQWPGVDPRKAVGSATEAMMSGVGGNAPGAVRAAVRHVGDMVSSAPRLATTLMAGLGLTASPSEAGPANKAELDPRVAELSSLTASIEREKAKLEKQATINFQSKTARDNAAAPILEGITQMQQRAGVIQGQLDKEMAAQAESNKPFNERHPDAAMALTIGGPIASGVLGGGAISLTNKYGATIAKAADEARKSMNMPEFAKQAMKVQNWEQWAPWAKRAAMGEAALIPAELRVAGDMIDKKTLPSTSPAQQAAAAKLGDPLNYALGMGQDIASGGIGTASGALAGSLLSRSPKVETQTMGSYLRGIDTKKLSPDEIAMALRSRAESAEGLPKSQGMPQTEASQPSLSAQLRSPNPLPTAPLETQPSLPALTSPRTARAGQSDQSSLPSWASETPEGVKLDPGHAWDANMGRQRNLSTGNFGPAVRYSPTRVKREDGSNKTQAPEEKTSVQMNDMGPLKYEN